MWVSNFTADRGKLSAAKVLLTLLGEDAIISLPLPVLIGYLEALVEKYTSDVAYMSSRREVYASRVKTVTDKIDLLNNLKYVDSKVLKDVAVPLAQAGLSQGADAQHTLNRIACYKPLGTALSVATLEVDRIDRLLLRKSRELQDIQGTLDGLQGAAKLVSEVKEFIHYLHRHNIATSYIINLDLDELIKLLEVK